jgi:hypothetical protein
VNSYSLPNNAIHNDLPSEPIRISTNVFRSEGKNGIAINQEGERKFRKFIVLIRTKVNYRFEFIQPKSLPANMFRLSRNLEPPVIPNFGRNKRRIV